MLNRRCFVLSVLVVLTLLKDSAGYFDVNTNANILKDARSSRALPTNCDEALAGSYKKEGIFLLQLPNYPDPFFVNCIQDPKNGSAWALVQRRQCGVVDFYRDWGEYATGFGDLDGEFFIGLKKLNAFTQLKGQELWVQLEDFNGEQRYAKYGDFKIGDYRTNYTLQSVGTFEGTAGDSLEYHIGNQFATKDLDNANNCAKRYLGAWWFNNCFYSHLNGPYYGNNVKKPYEVTGISWFHFHDKLYSFKYAHMAVRPRN